MGGNMIEKLVDKIESLNDKIKDRVENIPPERKAAYEKLIGLAIEYGLKYAENALNEKIK
jgi:hypothetical protein